ncbi:hypothetical protein D3C80_1970960 [compost metagenome]
MQTDFSNGQCDDELHGSFTALVPITIGDPLDDVGHGTAVGLVSTEIELSGQGRSQKCALNDAVVVPRKHFRGEQDLLQFTRF